MFSKGTNKLNKAEDSEEPDITKEEFLEFGKSIWKFNTANAKQTGHPAPFPLELAYRCIKLFTFPGDLVIDPFVGSGTTCLAAKKTGRTWLGYDLDPKWIQLAETRMKSI